MIEREDNSKSSYEIEELKNKIAKYIRAKERLEDAYYFSDDGMSEKEYLEKKTKFETMRIDAENKLKLLNESQLVSRTNEFGFIRSASSFLLAHKINAGTHIEYGELAGTIDEESIKELFNLVLDHISVRDRRIVEIVFSNGLSHKIIYKE